jgi:hypothetical protein
MWKKKRNDLRTFSVGYDTIVKYDCPQIVAIETIVLQDFCIATKP